ncbi:MAG: hypothetical protein AB1638_02825 [Nitrospirota bacterium]
MEQIKIVVRYADGRVIKGYTRDFFPNKSLFHLHPADKPSGEGIEVLLKDLKAIFFVRDFEGKPSYNERKDFTEGKQSPGRKIEITFADGEMLVGTIMGYDPQRPGFFLFPPDPQSNNLRIFVVSKAVSKFRYL